MAGLLWRNLRIVPVATLLLAGPVFGQQDTVAVRDSAAVRLPTLDVTVTATRSTRRPLEQPLAITAIQPAAWLAAPGHSLEKALQFVPGVIAQSRSGGTDIRISIRGFGARGAGDRSNSGTSRGVRVLTDGFPETEPDGRTAFDLVDLASITSIEVIRSNASAVWGNAAGGVVSLSTLRETSRAYAGVETGMGSFGLRRLVGQLGLPLGDGLGGLTVTRTMFDGYRANSAGERTLVTGGINTPLGERGRLGVFASGTSNFFEIPGPLTREQAEQTPEAANAVYQARSERRWNRLGRLGAVYEHHAGERHEVRGTIYIQPKFLVRSERGTYRDFTRYHVGGSMVYRYSHPLGPASGTLSAGVDEAYQDGAILFYSLTPDGERGDDLRANKREGANNLGVFVQEELSFGDRWGIVAGARFDNIAYSVQDFMPGGVSGDKSFRRVTPKFGLNYRRVPTHSLYLSFGGGVEAPAGNETDPAGTFGQDTVYAISPVLEPIISTTIELGTKQVLAIGDGAAPVVISYDGAVYYTAVTNEIVPYRGGRFYFTAGKAGRAGAELGGRVERGRVALLAASSYSHYRYLDYVVDSVHYGKPGASADYGGNRVVGIPDWSLSIGVEWTPPLVDGLRARVSYTAMTRYFADDANQVEVPGYGVVGLQLGLDQPIALGGGLGVRGAIGVENLFDTRYFGSAYLNPDVVDGRPLAFEPGMPRSVTMSLRLGWR